MYWPIAWHVKHGNNTIGDVTTHGKSCMIPSTSRPCHLEDVVLVGHQICDHEAELRGGQEVGHLVVVGVARQPRLDDELVRALAARHEPVPGHLHARQRHLQTRV